MAERTQPARTPLKKAGKEWVNGFACALAEMLRQTQHDAQAAKATMRAAGMTMNDLLAADLCESDWNIIARAVAPEAERV